MVLQKGDFIRINFSGKLKETGEVFDTTIEDVAKKNHIYDPKLIFKARPVVIGARHVLAGMDKGLEGVEIGEKKTFLIKPEDGFGKRDPAKIKLMPLREFKKKGIDPIPGMRLEFEDSIGRIQSVSGGRVRIDLNHGLAGKVLEYEVKVEEKINKTEEKIRQLLELYITNVDPQTFGISLKNKIVSITLPDSMKVDPSSNLGKLSATRDIFTFIEDVDQIEFKEVHKRLGKEKKKEKPTIKKAAKKKTTQGKKKSAPVKSSG